MKTMLGRRRQRFALKRMICGTEEQLKLARDEVELLGRLDHPNIVKLIDSGEERDATDTQIVVLMLLSLHKNGRGNWAPVPMDRAGDGYRRLSGSLLAEIQRRRQTDQWFSERELLGLFLKIASAVSYLHNDADPPIVHRDIKVRGPVHCCCRASPDFGQPGNVLLDDKLGAVLTDFGSTSPAVVTVTTRQEAARLQDQAAQYSTITYRAPELLHVKPNTNVTSKTDVWSLGTSPRRRDAQTLPRAILFR